MTDNNENFGGSIFEDLGIEFTRETLTNYDAAKKFAEQVYAADEMLAGIMNPDVTPVSKIEDKARTDWRDNKEYRKTLKETFDETLTALYESGEKIELPLLYGLIDSLERLTSDLKNTLHTRAQMESSSMDESIIDKKLAQVLHKRLREAFQSSISFINMFVKAPDGKMIGIQGIKGRSGNFQAGVFDPIAFFFPGNEEPYFFHQAVAKKLGIYYDGITKMDVMEYAEKHPDLVTMKQMKI